jgi:predicted ArsR family transcriptional regulator
VVSHRSLDEPQVMKALSHPLRIRLLAMLMLDGPSTASDCAQELEATVQDCSFHLRVLGRFGLAERVDVVAKHHPSTGRPDRRRHPWRATVDEVDLTPPADMSAEDAAARAALLLHVARIDDGIVMRALRSPAVRGLAPIVDNDVRWLRPEQAAELDRQVHALVAQYAQTRAEAPDAQRCYVGWRIVALADAPGT